MNNWYILSIDQSTKATKALLLDKNGKLFSRTDVCHQQILNDKGWVEHNPIEIFNNTIEAVKKVVKESGINKNDIVGCAISNQRETAVTWNRETGNPVYNAIVWQCARAEKICEDIAENGHKNVIKERTGLNLSPYFTAAKISWILKNQTEAKELSDDGKLCCGTIDSWLLFKLTNGKVFKTDYSNAARTQLLNINTLKWDNEICEMFEINPSSLAEICYSDELFAKTDFDGFFDDSIPIHAVLGDSNGALFGQGCYEKGMLKCTYGTGSSVMMNIGSNNISSSNLVTSLAWGYNNKVEYVMEGNINHTGDVISWIKEDLNLINSEDELSELEQKDLNNEGVYFVPAFSGLGAPYWNSNIKAMICGIKRNTDKYDIIRAAEESIVYQITDVVKMMQRDAEIEIKEVRADGGPTNNKFLMQFQSDMLDIKVSVSEDEEQSGIGVGYLAGISLGLYEKQELIDRKKHKTYSPEISEDYRKTKYEGWLQAVEMLNK